MAVASHCALVTLPLRRPAAVVSQLGCWRTLDSMGMSRPGIQKWPKRDVSQDPGVRWIGYVGIPD